MNLKNHQKLYKKLPNSPGVYIMKDDKKILYIGKAANLKKRVSSYFLKEKDEKIKLLLSKLKKISFLKTNSVIEALILESKLIKKYKPPFNVKEKDDKSFLYIKITNEKLPRVILARERDKENGEMFGPFVSAKAARELLKVIRKIFPFNTHKESEIGKNKPCFYYQIGLCPGACVKKINQKEYQKTIENIKSFLAGKTAKIIKKLEREMRDAAKNLNFEKANIKKQQLFAIKNIEDYAVITESEMAEEIKEFKDDDTEIKRIEGYDISNIDGKHAVGAMVVFLNNIPAKNEYRLFKIKTLFKANDTGMLREVLTRRLKNEWKKPDLILVDGGMGQVNALKEIIKKFNLKIKIIGIAKGVKRKENKIIGKIPSFTNLKTLIKVRDEAHRFAIFYHRKIRNKNFIQKLT